MNAKIGVRWTIGDVSPNGFEALRLSAWGLWKIFGRNASYVICLNSIPLDKAMTLTGDLPAEIEWHFSEREIPAYLTSHLDPQMAEGAAWKFFPLRLFPDRYEISLDNNVIIWNLPESIFDWLGGKSNSCLLAEDVRACFGQFSQLCGTHPMNAGIRGFPPQFDLEKALQQVLKRHPVRLESELDEQGLQVAALSQRCIPSLVRLEEICICSPFPPHLPSLGRSGAHFVGLNARDFPWSLNGTPASRFIEAHWRKMKIDLYKKIGISPPNENLSKR